MMTQKDADEWDKLTDLVKYATRLGQHPGDTHARYWWCDAHSGCWLYPGEFIVERASGKRYILGMREV
jgi:hypothetical protein